MSLGTIWIIRTIECSYNLENQLVIYHFTLVHNPLYNHLLQHKTFPIFYQLLKLFINSLDTVFFSPHLYFLLFLQQSYCNQTLLQKTPISFLILLLNFVHFRLLYGLSVYSEKSKLINLLLSLAELHVNCTDLL